MKGNHQFHTFALYRRSKLLQYLVKRTVFENQSLYIHVRTCPNLRGEAKSHVPGATLLAGIEKPSGDGRWDAEIEGVADGD